MKIGELLELTQTEPLDNIAKNHLSIGKNAARDALKAAGCYSKNGVRGWFYEGDPAVLEQSIYDFSSVKKSQTERKNVRTNPQKKQSTNEPRLNGSDEQTNEQKKTPLPVSGQDKAVQIVRKRASFDVDTAILKELKLFCVENDLNLYEAAENAFRDYLDKHRK